MGALYFRPSTEGVTYQHVETQIRTRSCLSVSHSASLLLPEGDPACLPTPSYSRHIILLYAIPALEVVPWAPSPTPTSSPHWAAL